MTPRGFWFVSVAFTTLLISIALPYQFSLAFLSTAALLGAWLHWAIHHLRIHLVARRLQLERSIDGQPAGRKNLWEHRPARVELTVRNPSPWSLPLMKVSDLVPTNAEVRGQWSIWAPCSARGALRIEYELRPRMPGFLGFEGVRVEMKDPLGFFSSAILVRDRRLVTVWPALAVGGTSHVARKRSNRLSGHGVHRYLRAGSGTELLNLRDYVEGDPPKRIAWRISARRDQLTTKELESEVPVRCWIIVDHSDAVRLGWPGPSALHQSVRIAAGLTEDLIQRRDPVGLWLVDEQGATCVPAAPGTRQRSRIIGELCRIASQAPKPSPCPPSLLLDPAWEACKRFYPEQMSTHVNPRDWRYEWPWSRILWQGSVFVLLIAGLLALTYVTVLRRELPLWLRALFVLLGGLGALVVGALTLRGRSVQRGQARRRRRQVASLVAAVGDLGPAGLSLGMNDDEYFSRNVQEFLIVHGVSYPRPLHDAAGRYLFRSDVKLAGVARALLHTISHGRDDEVFVLLVDVLEHEEAWGGLMDAIKVARARHHHVVLICPWPGEIPLPDSPRGLDVFMEEKLDSRHPSTIESQALARRYVRAFRHASERLGRLGVPLIAASREAAISEILRRVELVRMARIPVRT